MSLLSSRSAAARVPKRPTMSVATPSDAVARLERGADVDERGALGDRRGPGRRSSSRPSRWPWRRRASGSWRSCGCDDRRLRWAPSQRCCESPQRVVVLLRAAGLRAVGGFAGVVCGGVCRRGFGHVDQPLWLDPKEVVLEVFVDQSIHRTLVCNPLPQACYSGLPDFVTVSRAISCEIAENGHPLCNRSNAGSASCETAQSHDSADEASPPSGRGPGRAARCAPASRPGRRARRAWAAPRAPPTTRLRPAIPPRATTPSQNALPCSYWRSLRSMPDQPLEHPQQAGAVAAAPVQRAAQSRRGRRARRRRRRPSRARRSPRARAMNACTRSSIARRSRRPRRREAVLAHLVEQPRAGRTGRAPAAGRAGRPRARRAARARIPARCARSHGTPPNCSACVISCSATQRSSWSGSALQRRRRMARGWAPRTAAARARRDRAPGTRTGRARARRGSRRRAGLDRQQRRRRRAPSGPSLPPSRSATGSSTPLERRAGWRRSSPARSTASARRHRRQRGTRPV